MMIVHRVWGFLAVWRALIKGLEHLIEYAFRWMAYLLYFATVRRH